MNCPKCGAPTNPGAGFCPNCGATIAAPVQRTAPPAAPASKSNKKLLIIAVVAIIAVLIIAAAAASIGGNTKANDNNNNDSNNSNTDNTNTNPPTNTNSQVTMTVSKVSGYHSTESFEQASDGNILVMVYANITNNGALSNYVSPLDFFLICSDGKSYTYSWKLDSFNSAYLDHGEKMAIFCSFEIPQGVTPKTFKYDDSTDSISVTLASSIIDLSYPQYVSITGVSHAEVASDSPYLGPDPGNVFVQVTMTFRSSMPAAITMSTYYFTLETSDGQTHDATYYVDPVIPDGLQPGASTTVKITFEISQSSTPTKLIYDDYVNHVTVGL